MFTYAVGYLLDFGCLLLPMAFIGILDTYRNDVHKLSVYRI